MAAANPCSEVYDYNEPIIANMSFPVDLLEKFDIVVPFLPNSDEEIEELLQHNNKEEEENNMSTQELENDFFESSTMPEVSPDNAHWLKKAKGESLPRIAKKDIQIYVKYALESCRPKLSEEAKLAIKEFYDSYSVEMPHEYQDVWTLAHLCESLTRLTLARARIDFAEKATVEHVKQVLSLFKAAQIDVYPQHDIANTSFNSSSFYGANKTQDVSKLSKPKQMKAFLELLQSKSKSENCLFSNAKLMDMAIELGISDYYEVITRLNYDGFIIKTPNGFKVVKSF